MEILAFGHAGTAALVFPTSGGRFYEFEDNGMVSALAGKIDAGRLQLFCVDSVNSESWYDRRLPPRLRVARHAQFESYVLNEVVPLVREVNGGSGSGGGSGGGQLIAAGCSFGGYHAVNLALRRPEIFSGFVSLSGAFDLSGFLDGYCDEDCYYHLPTFYLPNLTDEWFLDCYKQNSFVLASGWDDVCLAQNQDLDRIMTEKGIAHEFDIWDEPNSHDWPTWRRMAQQYL